MTFTPEVLINVREYLAGCNLTGFGNKIETHVAAEALDKTVWASGGWKSRTGGTFDGDFSADVFWQAGDASMPDDVAWASLGLGTVPHTATPNSAAVGTTAILGSTFLSEYKPAAPHGQLLAATLTGQTSDPMVRGQIIHSETTARTATGNGTAVQLGAVSAAQALYANLHILTVADAAATLTVKIQSDDNSGFTSPTDRAIFTAASAVGGQVARIVGAITDNYWRASWTIAGGSTPSFVFVVSAGIGPK